MADRSYQPRKPRSAGARFGNSGQLDGTVPHYNVFGHQHHKLPFVDNSFYVAEKDTNYWKNVCPWGRDDFFVFNLF